MKNEFKGKVSANMSPFDVAKKWKINPIDFVPILEKGTKHEMEHTDNIDVARRIALDHIVERLDYYDRLDKIEKMHLGGDMSKYLAPNGKPSNLNHKQWHLVRTPEFKAWFGDWENDPKNASKVVDENGEPLVVYHGTKSNFNIFNMVDRIKEFNVKDYGAYFTNDKETAKIYSLDFSAKTEYSEEIEKKYQQALQKYLESKTEGDLEVLKKLSTQRVELSKNLLQSFQQKYVIECFLSIKTPYIIDANGKLWSEVLVGKVDTALDNNNNGIIIKNMIEVNSIVQTTYIAFEPNQIKLADGTNTTFDANNPDIRFDEGGKVPFNIHREFNEYVDKLPKFGYHGTQSETLVNPRPSKDGRYGEGFYLTLDPDTAEYFGRFTKTSEGYSKENESANVFEFDLRGLNLKYYKKAEDMPYIDFDGLNNKNYDGVYFYYEGEIVIFNIHKLPDGKLVHSKNNDINFAKGGRTIAQTPAPFSDRVYGSKTNPKGTASDSQLARNIKFNESLIKAIENKVQAHNKDYPSKKVTLPTAKAVVRRGMGAYSKSHRPTITGGAPNSRQAWGLARLNKFLLKKRGVKVKSAYIQDDDLL